MTEDRPASDVEMRSRVPAGLRLAAVALVVVAVLIAASLAIDRGRRPPSESPAAAPLSGPAPLHVLSGRPGDPGPAGDPTVRTLVLYSEGDQAAAGHEGALQAAHLASHRGGWAVKPVERYSPGEMTGYALVIYVGYYTAAPLSPAFLTDVDDLAVPVLWLGANVEQVFERNATAAARYGWRTGEPDPVPSRTVEYGGKALVRNAEPDELLETIELLPGGRAETVGEAVREDGSRRPWAVRSGSLTYVSEAPFSYVRAKDRYLALADVIDRMLVPEAPTRHRALIRIEDVGPNTDPEHVRRIADLLSARGIPFSLATYAYFRDPNGAVHSGDPVAFRLVDAPELVEALRYAQERGGTLILHGYTHQYESAINPYNGTSGADYEFVAAHVDAENRVQIDGPVPDDSRAWAADRLATARAEFVRVGLPDPGIFEFPHYAGSVASYQAVHDMFGVRYDRGTYYGGQCPAGACSTEDTPSDDRMFPQYFPYSVRDAYGSIVIPENVENISEAYNDNDARTAADLIAAADALTVVRDGVASAYFHPFLPVEQLDELVTGIEQKGFRFVAPSDILYDR